MFEKLKSLDLIVIAISNLLIGIYRETQVQDTYPYNIHTLQNSVDVLIVIVIRTLHLKVSILIIITIRTSTL